MISTNITKLTYSFLGVNFSMNIPENGQLHIVKVGIGAHA